jgi:hypothetical protein
LPFDDYTDDEPDQQVVKKYRMDDKDSTNGMQQDDNGSGELSTTIIT